MTNGILTDREIQTRAGKLKTTIFEEGQVIFSIHKAGIMIDLHLTREEAATLSKALETVVAAYDATVDHYHDVCDEPATAEAH